MTKQQEIEEMAAVLSDDFCATFDDGQGQDCSLDCDKCRAHRVVEAGYRKADEVRKEADAEIAKLKSALADAVRSFTRMETLYRLKCNKLESTKESACKEKAKEILSGLVHWLKGAISDSYNHAVREPFSIYGGKNLAFHEMLDLVKKIVEKEGVEVDE